MRRINDKNGRNDRNEVGRCMMRMGSGAGGKTGQGARNGVSRGMSKVAIGPNVSPGNCAE